MKESIGKPLGIKNYGSIGHLPDSRLGPGDHSINQPQARICCEKPRDRHDVVIVQEKLDGSNVGVAKIGERIVALTRSGWPAKSSTYEQHQIFDQWVFENKERFNFLEEGQRLVGEWLALAHGTIYKLPHEPFVAFDLMIRNERTPYLEFMGIVGSKFVTPRLLNYGHPVATKWIDKILDLGNSYHGAQEKIEGAVYRVERRGKVDFLAKYVREGKEDGKYLKENIWNWHPNMVQSN